MIRSVTFYQGSPFSGQIIYQAPFFHPAKARPQERVEENSPLQGKPCAETKSV